MTMGSEKDVFKETRSKKQQIEDLFDAGTTDIAEIVRKVKARPSYVAQVLQQTGRSKDLYDIYNIVPHQNNVYSRYFKNVLKYGSEEEARESVQRLDRLFNYFERMGDHAAQHQAMVLALTGKNRTRWAGKPELSQIFHDWLVAH
jgi:hypothetical protein